MAKKAKSKAKPPVKAAVKKRSLNAPGATGSSGAPMNEQDPKRRLGNYGGAGEHPRQGGRTSGIVGQTKQQNKTDKGKNQKKP
jgi:hypothetical protein